MSKYALSLFILQAAFPGCLVNGQGIVKYNFKSVASHPLEKRDLTSEHLELDVKLNFLFMGNVSIGNPPQDLTMLFDTGSYKLWGRSSRCVDCQVPNCTAGSTCTKSYNSTKSSTYTVGRVGEKLEYQSGQTILGNVAYDKVAFSGLSVSNFSFVEATSVPSTLGFDGVMGMALFPRSGELFVDRLIKSGSLDAPVFSFWISGDKSSAELTIGGIDLAKNASVIEWIPLIVNKALPYWAASLGNITIASSNSTSASPNSVVVVDSRAQAIFDSGTSYSYLPQSLAKDLNTKLGATYFSGGSSAGVDAYHFNCSNRYPNISVVLGGKTFDITSDEYINVFDASPSKLCLSSFFGRDMSGDIGFLLGNAILRRWQVTYNLDTYEIGIAIANRSTTLSDLSSRGLAPVSQGYAYVGSSAVDMQAYPTKSSTNSIPTSTNLAQKSNGKSVLVPGGMQAALLAAFLLSFLF